ncbi:DndE family protein [Mesonia maritima]|uniref:DNA sulfur modification protein DndE n=1 Tax=Mesonia maritima TaxID=1793873 RepID=A0ABU1K2R6_9FLAO|nr:DndE family protein [Mesonia maritima]MDR6299902.1 DNA sulfur modification protein DndE [Mesonia maritima]
MFTHIKTSKENREVVAHLTRKLNLGTENIISRIALTYSLSKDRKLNLKDIQNSGGKGYSKSVLFGDYLDYYVGMVALHYNIHITDKDLAKYVKMHIDDGLQLLDEEISTNSNLDGFEFLADKIEKNLINI